MLSICVAMVGVSVITAVDKAAADSVVVVVAPSVGKRAANSHLICSSLEPVETRLYCCRSKRIELTRLKAKQFLQETEEE